VADGAGKIVESLPTEIADVVTGRSWSADKQGGFYRAILAMTGAEKDWPRQPHRQMPEPIFQRMIIGWGDELPLAPLASAPYLRSKHCRV
jgi:hypothetical protein